MALMGQILVMLYSEKGTGGCGVKICICQARALDRLSIDQPGSNMEPRRIMELCKAAEVYRQMTGYDCREQVGLEWSVVGDVVFNRKVCIG